MHTTCQHQKADTQSYLMEHFGLKESNYCNALIRHLCPTPTSSFHKKKKYINFKSQNQNTIKMPAAWLQIHHNMELKSDNMKHCQLQMTTAAGLGWDKKLKQVQMNIS